MRIVNRWSPGRATALAAGLTVLLLLAGSPSLAPSAAAQQSGGLPDLAIRVANLEATVTTLQTANSSLQAALNAEVAARAAADSALQTALSQETAQRSAGDASLQAALNAEVNNRAVANQALQQQIKLQLESGLQVFTGQGGVSPELNNNAPTVVASVDVPAGRYLIQAVVPVINFDPDEQGGTCALSTRASTPGAFSGNLQNVNGAVISLRLNKLGSVPFNAEIPLVDTAGFQQPTTISVLCTGFQWTALSPTIEALRLSIP